MNKKENRPRGTNTGDGKGQNANHHFEPIITPHQLRHWYAAVLYEAEVDVKVDQEFLGHADIHTTMQIYTDLCQNQRKAQIAKLSARMGKSGGIKVTTVDAKTASIDASGLFIAHGPEGRGFEFLMPCQTPKV